MIIVFYLSRLFLGLLKYWGKRLAHLWHQSSGRVSGGNCSSNFVDNNANAMTAVTLEGKGFDFHHLIKKFKAAFKLQKYYQKVKRCTSCNTSFKVLSCHNYFKTAVILKYCNTSLKWLFMVTNPHSEWSSPFFLAPNDQSCATASGVIVMDRVTSNQGSNSIHREKLGQKYFAF